QGGPVQRRLQRRLASGPRSGTVPSAGKTGGLQESRKGRRFQVLQAGGAPDGRVSEQRLQGVARHLRSRQRQQGAEPLQEGAFFGRAAIRKQQRDVAGQAVIPREHGAHHRQGGGRVGGDDRKVLGPQGGIL